MTRTITRVFFLMAARCWKQMFILFSAAAILALPTAASAGLILVGFERWNAVNPNTGVGATNPATTTATGFSGDSILTAGVWGRTVDGAHNDGTFGTKAGADPATGFDRGLRLTNAPSGSYDFTILNSSGSSVDLGAFHFDTATFRPNSPDDWTVAIVAGDLTAQTVDMASDIPSITGGVRDWYDRDVDLTGITGGNTLANGQTATFRLTFAGGSAGGSDHQYLDNIGISAIPEPSSVAMLGLASLGLFVRRRK